MDIGSVGSGSPSSPSCDYRNRSPGLPSSSQMKFEVAMVITEGHNFGDSKVKRRPLLRFGCSTLCIPKYIAVHISSSAQPHFILGMDSSFMEEKRNGINHAGE